MQKPNINLYELRSLLDQYNYPCMIWDQKNDKIIQINNRWENLTKFIADDLINTSIDNIVPQFKEGNQDCLEEISIRNKDGYFIKCQHDVIPLGSSRKLLFIKCLPLFTSGFKLKNDDIQLAETFSSLLDLESNKGFLYLAEACTALLNDLYDSSCSAFYLNSDMTPDELRCLSVSGDRELIQKTLDANEFNFQQNMSVWKNVDRALNTLQRNAKQKEIFLLITATFKLDGDYKGLLLIAFKNRNIDENDLIIFPAIYAILLKNFKNAARFLIKKNENSKNWLFSNEQIENILCSASIGIIISDEDKKVFFSNPYAEKLFGYEKWELTGQFTSEIFLSSDDAFPQIHDDQNGVTKNMNLRKRDGSIFTAQILSQRLQTNSLMNNEFHVFFIEDASEVNKLHAQVAQLTRQAEMGVLVASFAHDVRNVFNSIKLNADTVQLLSPENIDINNKMASIKDDCDEVNQLMESVLSFSSSIEKNKKPIDLGFMIERVVERWKPKLEKMKIHHVLQISEEIPLIFGDARSLEQAFNNLINNARDAMGQKGGTLGIDIKETLPHDSVCYIGISFSDTGAGIPSENLQKIFDPFFSSRPGGTGLGLAITRKIVEYHGGRLEVSSFPGGTTFTVLLPIKPVGEN